MANKVVIRDQITINSGFSSFLSGVNSGETLTLVARTIQHDGATDIILAGQVLSIIADSYVGNGRAIRTAVSGGGPGNPGSVGAVGIATSTGAGNRPGGPGGPGTPGLGGSAAGSVHVLARSVTALHIIAVGGPGGPGGAGGQGGHGGDGRVVRRPIDPITIEGTGGGPGGAGAIGGPGGAGGHCSIAAVQFTSAPFVEIAGGPGGPGGAGGAPGVNGKLSDTGPAQRGPAGPAGRGGPVGASTTVTISDDQFFANATAALGAGSATWALYRHSVGEYFFRRYNPAVAARSSDLQVAVGEFQSALRITPSLTQSARLRDNAWQNNTLIGLNRDLDVIPHFDEYLQAFTSFGNLVLGFLSIGSMQLLQAVNLDALNAILTLQQQTTQNRIADTQDQLAISQAEQKDTQDAVAETNKKISDVTAQIAAAQAELDSHSMSIGDIVGVVGEVAGAVVSIIGAIPTGGASLVALVPDVIALTKTISDSAIPLVQSLLSDGNSADTIKQIKDQYGKVSKDATEVINQTKTVINMVKMIEKIAAGATPDNSKVVALVQRAAELAHELLLRQRAVQLAGMRVDADKASISRGQDLLAATQAAITANQFNDHVIREAGLRTIRNAQLELDILLGFAFRAERSVEIYTLKDETANLFLDAGYIHPDTESDYREGRINDAQLIAAYSDSWTRLLQPIRMQSDYLAYFDDATLNSDLRRLSFSDAAILADFTTSHTLNFTIEPTDLPPERGDTKAINVFIAFVGATSPSGVISCQVQHGNRYTQVRTDGTRSDQLLQARTVTLPARTQPLEIGDVVLGGSPPLTSPQALPFWGRGLCGRWQVTIPDSELTQHHPDLSSLSQIQVWLGYQFKQ